LSYAGPYPALKIIF